MAPHCTETHFQASKHYWKRILKHDYPVRPGSAAQPALESVSARFFEDEPDPNRRDKPRLDIVLTFADGRWVRYRPKAILSWSDEQLPSQAMRTRYNRAANLKKRAESDRQ